MRPFCFAYFFNFGYNGLAFEQHLNKIFEPHFIPFFLPMLWTSEIPWILALVGWTHTFIMRKSQVFQICYRIYQVWVHRVIDVKNNFMINYTGRRLHLNSFWGSCKRLPKFRSCKPDILEVSNWFQTPSIIFYKYQPKK